MHWRPIDNRRHALDRWPGPRGPLGLGALRSRRRHQPEPGERERPGRRAGGSRLAAVRCVPTASTAISPPGTGLSAPNDRNHVLRLGRTGEAQGLRLSDLFHFRVIEETCAATPLIRPERLFGVTHPVLRHREQLNRFLRLSRAHNPAAAVAVDLAHAIFHLLAAAECADRTRPSIATGHGNERTTRPPGRPQADGRRPSRGSPPAGSWPGRLQPAGAVGGFDPSRLDWIALLKWLPG